MAKFPLLNEFFRRTASMRRMTGLDKLNFFNIFVLWGIITLLFGTIYYFAPTSQTYLFNEDTTQRITSYHESLYFSFSTAIGLSYARILPTGFFHAIALLQKIVELLLLALVTSKFVSIKQNVILAEVYQISFNEKLNRLRSSLLVFRQNISRLNNKIEENYVKKREIYDMYIHMAALEDSLNEIYTITINTDKAVFNKLLSPVSVQLLFNSMISSFEKLHELIAASNNKNLPWNREITINLIKNCVQLTNAVFEKFNTTNMLTEKAMKDIVQHKDEVISKIMQEVERSSKAIHEEKKEEKKDAEIKKEFGIEILTPERPKEEKKMDIGIEMITPERPTEKTKDETKQKDEVKTENLGIDVVKG